MSALTRRRALQAVAAGLAAGLAGCESGATDELCGERSASKENTVERNPTGTAPAPAADSAWALAHHDVAQTSYTHEAGPIDDVGLAWQITVGENYGTTRFVVADGTLVATHSEDGRLVALDPTDASERWAVDRHLGVGWPAVADDLVVVGDRRGLHGYALVDGTHRWSFEPNQTTATPSPDAAAGESADPTTALSATRDSANGVRTTVAAGDDQSTQPAEAPAAVRFFDPPLAVGETILARGADGVYAVSREGTGRWHAGDWHLGAIDGDTAYLTGPSGLRSVDVRTGETRLRADETTISPDVAIRDGTVYTADVKEVVAVDAATGETVWTFEGEWESFETPTVTPEYVFAASAPTEGSDGGNVYALDRATGEPVWCRFLGHSTVDTPAATEDTVFLATEKVVEARNADSGDVRWRYAVNDSTYFRNPAVVSGVCYVATESGDLYAFAER